MDSTSSSAPSWPRPLLVRPRHRMARARLPVLAIAVPRRVVAEHLAHELQLPVPVRSVSPDACMRRGRMLMEEAGIQQQLADAC